MANQDSENNNTIGVSVTHPKVVVLGDHAIIHVTETQGNH
jgi:hypothetical protein